MFKKWNGTLFKLWLTNKRLHFCCVQTCSKFFAKSLCHAEVDSWEDFFFIRETPTCLGLTVFGKKEKKKSSAELDSNFCLLPSSYFLFKKFWGKVTWITWITSFCPPEWFSHMRTSLWVLLWMDALIPSDLQRPHSGIWWAPCDRVLRILPIPVLHPSPLFGWCAGRA